MRTGGNERIVWADFFYLLHENRGTKKIYIAGQKLKKQLSDPIVLHNR